MHEQSLINDLLAKVRQLARQHAPARLTAVRVELGALAHISAPHLEQHFRRATEATDLEGVRLLVECNPDIHAPTAQDILLKSVDLSED